MALRYGTPQFLLKSTVRLFRNGTLVRYASKIELKYGTLVRYGSRCKMRSTQILNVPYRTANLGKFTPEVSNNQIVSKFVQFLAHIFAVGYLSLLVFLMARQKIGY